MNLKTLTKNLDCKTVGNININIEEISTNSKTVTAGGLFVCLVGENADGHNYVLEAIKNEAVAVVCERELKNISVPQIIVESTRKACSKLFANFYDNPQNKLKLIGITGTNGKTTTSFLIKSILENAGKKVGLIGTQGVMFGSQNFETGLTTPDPEVLFKMLVQMVNFGIEYVVMEVSSQALKVGRCEGLVFDCGIFTNMSRDHIGENEHKDYEEYIECKSKLFKMCKVGIINQDDKEYDYMLKDATCKIKTFGFNGVDYKLQSYDFLNKNGLIGMNFILNDKFYEIFTPGMFSVYNAMCAISLADCLNINYDLILKVLKDFKVKGRVEPINISDKFSVLIDYAHEAMSLESLLTTIKEYNPKRIVTLFGCGGNRSKNRRFEMGEISGKYSDLTIITEDNSRFENVLDIIEDIKIGIKKTNGKYVAIPNRRDAIKYAIENAQDGDIILLCGKGHEDYQEINGKKIHMDEREIIEDVINEL